MTLAAGSLDQRIEVQVVTVTRNELNEEVRGWAKLRDVWARVVQAQGREFLKGDQVQAEAKAVFIVRFASDISSLNQVVWRGRTYEIENVTGTRRDGELWLHCRSVTGANA